MSFRFSLTKNTSSYLRLYMRNHHHYRYLALIMLEVMTIYVVSRLLFLHNIYHDRLYRLPYLMKNIYDYSSMTLPDYKNLINMVYDNSNLHSEQNLQKYAPCLSLEHVSEFLLAIYRSHLLCSRINNRPCVIRYIDYSISYYALSRKQLYHLCLIIQNQSIT